MDKKKQTQLFVVFQKTHFKCNGQVKRKNMKNICHEKNNKN